MRKLSSVEENILDKTLYLIGKTGSFNVSIRAIAKEAEVNVGAINYYFETKDQMMVYVKKFYINNTILAYETLDNEKLSDEKKLILSANEIMEYTLKYPGILIILKEALDKKDHSKIDAKIVDVTDEMNKKLYKVLGSVTNDNKYNNMIFLSSILHPTIHFEIDSFDNEFLNDIENRIEYIKYILEKLK